MLPLNADKSSTLDPQQLKETLEPTVDLIGEGMRVMGEIIDAVGSDEG